MDRWGDFDLHEEIGHGGFGAVYRSTHPNLRQEVAVKLIPVADSDTRAIEKALDEPRRLASVRHPHVVVVHDARYADGHVGICMELVRGQSLDEIVRRNGPHDPDHAMSCVRTLAGALSAVHRAGIVHNDVKPRNAVREVGGRLVLMDFGAGRRLQDPSSTTGRVVIGTPMFMAPELFRLREPTPVSDIYSLGALWFFLLTGDYPVPGNTIGELARSHEEGRRRYLADFRDDVPEQIEHILERTLDPDPARRFQTCGELIQAISNGTAAPAPAPSPAERPAIAPRPRIRILDRLLAVLAACLGAAVLVTGLGALAARERVVMFRIDPEFVSDSLGEWIGLGVRTLPLLVAYTVLALVLWAALALAWRIVRRSSRQVDRWCSRITTRVATTTARAGLDDAPSVATAILIAQAVVLAVLVGWIYRDIVTAMTTSVVERVLPEHALLSKVDDRWWLFFRLGMWLVTLAGGYAWWRVARSRSAASMGFTRLTAGVLLTAVSLLLATSPWAMVHDAWFEEATFGTDSCFVITERSPRVQLFCPSAAARMRVVSSTDSRLERHGTKKNLFAALTAPMARSGGP
jgi:serine/threonine-protein kinase